MEIVPQSISKRVPLKAYLASDHISPATGKTIAVVISKNGAAFGNPSAGATNATEIANGWYYVDLSTTDTGTLGPLIVRGTEGTIDDSEQGFTVAVATTDPWATALPGAYGAGTAGKIVGDNLDAAVSSRLAPTVAARTLDVTATGEAGIDWSNIGAPTTSVNLSGTSTKAVEPTVAGRTLDVTATGEAGIDWANIGAPTTVQNLSGTTILGAAATLSAAERNAIADALLDRNMATGTDSGSPTVRTPRQALRILRNKVNIAATLLTVKKEDDSTDSWTGTVVSSPGTASVTEIDPAGP